MIVGSSVAAYLYYNPLEKKQPETAEAESSEPAVISTAPKAKAPKEEVAETSEATEAEATEEAAADEGGKPASDDVVARLAEVLGGIDQAGIKEAPIPGWYEVARGSAIGYISADGKYLFDGDLIDLRTKANLTENRRNGWRKSIVSSIDESQMIIFEPEKVKHTITVFTDVDCGYCRKLHSEIQTYLDEGIRIRYVFYPLRGEKAKSFQTAEKVWCSENRQEALTQAKQGKAVNAEDCDNPVAMHLQKGMELGIRGTPGLITSEGKMLPGYMPAKTLLSELEKG